MLTSFVSPVRFGVLFGVLLVLVWRWLPRWLRMSALLPVVACAGLSLPLVANQLVRFQESRAPAATECTRSPPQTIVVLGGGSARRPRDSTDYAALGEFSLRRLFAAVHRWHEQTDARLVIAGGAGQYPVPESVLMSALAERLGVPARAITLESRSHSTWQNAQFARELETSPAPRIWLVTSALHMPRAVYAFEQAGFKVCPWPADSRYAEANSIGYYLPSTAALDKADAAIHEMVGEIAYRAGWLRSPTRDPWSGSDEQ